MTTQAKTTKAIDDWNDEYKLFQRFQQVGDEMGMQSCQLQMQILSNLAKSYLNMQPELRERT